MKGRDTEVRAPARRPTQFNLGRHIVGYAGVPMDNLISVAAGAVGRNFRASRQWKCGGVESVYLFMSVSV
jgi:hypothetical protein